MGERERSSSLLLVTRNFPPLWGGMERLNWHMAAELAGHYALTVIGPAGAAAHAPPGVVVREVPLTPLPRFLLAAGWQSVCVAWAERPAAILAGSGLTAPLVWLAARLSGARALAYVHGLDVTAPHQVYRLLWLPFLRRMDRVIANSRATAQLAERAGVRADRIVIVHPGVALPAPLPPAERLRLRADFRTRHGLGEGPLLLSVGRLTARKGLREFVAEVLPRIVATRPDVRLAVIGDAPTHALRAEAQTPESIQAAADAAGVGSHVRFLGVMHDMADLAPAYYASDAHVFPVRDRPSDPEGFGMVAIEAAAHGLPTVAYATGGVVDAVAEGVSGRLVAPGDTAAFADALLGLLAYPLPAAPMGDFATGFGWERFGEQLAQSLSGDHAHTV